MNQMNAKDILGIIVRGFGLYVVWVGIYDIWYSGMEATNLIYGSKIPASGNFIFGGFRLVAGYVILMRADSIADFACLQKRSPTS